MRKNNKATFVNKTNFTKEVVQVKKSDDKINFPLFKTKIKDLNRKFDLTCPEDQNEYFKAKAGEKIQKLRRYLKNNTFIAYFLGKKNAGKGTYTKMFADLVGLDKIDHFSVGDMVRDMDKLMQNPREKKELIALLEKNYRGWIPFKDIIKNLEQRNTKALLPNELILALTKIQIAKRRKKTIFIDGFPRNLDQISHSLFFRDLIGYRDDLDLFVLIDVPTAVIDERIKWRRVCPLCQTSRNLKLLVTSKINYQEKNKKFCLICDNSKCPKPGTEMVMKEGDELGTAPIKDRLITDGKLIKQAFSLYGIPKVLLRNCVPVKSASEYIDDYEITPEYICQWDAKNKKVLVSKQPWIIKDDSGVDSYSLMPQPVVLSLIDQIAAIFNL